MLIPTIRTVLLRDLDGLRRELEAYPDDAAVWAMPPGIANSAGTLALHLAGNLQHFLGARLGGTGYLRDRPGEFSRRDLPRGDLLADVDRARAAVDSTLSALDPAALDVMHPDSFTDGRRVTVGVLLVHLATHLAYHLGQIDYHRRTVTGQGAVPGMVGVP